MYNVSVGGTDFEDAYNAKEVGIPISTYWNSTNTATDGSAKSYIPEIPWNDSCAGYLLYNYEGYSAPYGTAGFCNSATAFLSTSAGGGGPSACATGGGGTDQSSYLEVDGTCAGYAKPSWQSGIFGNPADGVRDIPDVSLFAANGIWGHYATICFSDTSEGGTSCAGAPSTWSGFGGTSVASPMMAAIQALVNEKWGTSWQGSPRSGNPNPIYYQIAKAEFGSTGNSSCYSINQPPRRGLASSCVFYDITQGDNDVDCEWNGTYESGCYLPSSTYGVLSTQAPILTISAPGTGYTSQPTCALSQPPYTTPYLSPTGGTIYAGGTQATCTTGPVGTVGTLVVGTVSSSWTKTFVVGSTTYTLKYAALPTAVNQVAVCPSSCAGSAAAAELATAADIEAVINNNPSQCAVTGCVYSTQTANSLATASLASTTITLGPKTNGGTFTLSSAQTGLTATTTSTSGVASVSVSGVGGYTNGIPTACSLTGGGGSGATCAVGRVASVAPTGYAPAFYATPGWDFATGLGSVNAYNLVFNNAW